MNDDGHGLLFRTPLLAEDLAVNTTGHIPSVGLDKTDGKATNRNAYRHQTDGAILLKLLQTWACER